MTQSADILLTNAIVLTMDIALTKYEPGAVAVKGDMILAVGPEAEIKILPGVKLIRTDPGPAQTPRLHWARFDMSPGSPLKCRALLYYTGYTRMAKKLKNGGTISLADCGRKECGQ